MKRFNMFDFRAYYEEPTRLQSPGARAGNERRTKAPSLLVCATARDIPRAVATAWIESRLEAIYLAGSNGASLDDLLGEIDELIVEMRAERRRLSPPEVH